MDWKKYSNLILILVLGGITFSVIVWSRLKHAVVSVHSPAEANLASILLFVGILLSLYIPYYSVHKKGYQVGTKEWVSASVLFIIFLVTFLLEYKARLILPFSRFINTDYLWATLIYFTGMLYMSFSLKKLLINFKKDWLKFSLFSLLYLINVLIVVGIIYVVIYVE